MPESDHFEANLQRGFMLLNSGRPNEALAFAQAAIAADPKNANGYVLLARCYSNIPKLRAKSIDAIDRAISHEPKASHLHGLKGWFYVCLMDYHRAQIAAEKGLAIDPTCTQSLNAIANAHTKLRRWKKAETACRRILEIDPHNGPGLNLLAQALRYQGRWKESRETVARLLANMPNDAFGHLNAGHAALAAGDHLRANHHFLESLRIDPHSDHARRGLLTSLTSRNWIIRFNLRAASFIHRPATILNVALTVIGFLGSMTILVIVAGFLNNLHPWAGTLAFASLFGLLLFYAYLSGVVYLMGNFLLLFDPMGQHALTRQEKAKACIPLLGLIVVSSWLITIGQWPIAVALIGSLLTLALTIQLPLWYDRRQSRRLEQSET